MQIILLLTLLHVALGSQVSYDGHVVLRTYPKTEQQVRLINSLEEQYDVWRGARGAGDWADIRVSPEQQDILTATFTAVGIDYKVMIGDVGSIIREQETQRAGRPQHRDVELDQYNSLEEIQTWIGDLATTYDFVELVTMPEVSYEGRPIQLLKLSSGGDKPAMWVDGGIHAREWIAPATMVYFIDQFVTGYASADPEYEEMLDLFDWYILPVFNVDGYEYSWTTDRLWRKTRSPNEGSVCVGTDPNRNWDIEWGTVGISTNPCSDAYCGPAAFSEVEVKTVVDYIATIPNVAAYFAYHSYGQLYMAPVGYEATPTPDFDDHMRVCEEAEAAIEAVHNTPYICDQLYNVVGASSGSSADYTYAVMGIKYSYGVELRDEGDFGFLLPEDQIIPTSEESLVGIKVFAREIASELKMKNI